MFRSSNITAEFQAIRFDGFVTAGRPRCVREAYECVQHYLQTFALIRGSERNGIALYGKPGCGKTRLLIASANHLLGRGIGLIYLPWVEGSNELREAVRADKDNVQARIEALKTCEVLYIDDLYKGREEPTEFQREWLFDVVNYRYLNHLPIWLSTEKTPEQLIGIDEGIATRIHERAKAYTVQMRLTKEDKTAGMQLNYRLLE